MNNPLLCNLVTNFSRVFAEKIVCSPRREGVVEVKTPLQDGTGDFFRFFVKEQGNGSFILTDRGDVMMYLEMNNINTSNLSPIRRRFIEKSKFIFGVSYYKGEFFKRTTSEKFAQDSEKFLNFIREVSSLIILAQERTPTAFKEIIGEVLESFHSWLGPIEIDHPVRGLRAEHNIDFYIPRAKLGVPALVQTLSAQNKSAFQKNTSALLASFLDLRESKIPFKGIVVVNAEDDRLFDDWHLEQLPNYTQTTIFQYRTGGEVDILKKELMMRDYGDYSKASAA